MIPLLAKAEADRERNEDRHASDSAQKPNGSLS